jgi:hypothetical protein
MELSVFDRLILLKILPEEGDFTTLKIVRSLREDLSFSEEEHAALAFRNEGGKVYWKQEAEKTKGVDLKPKATELIVKALSDLNNSKKLREEHFSLYERFVGE